MMHNWRPTERLDTVLDRSIDRLDEETPESILREYPQSRTALAPMLQIADALRDLEQISMPPAAKQAGRDRLRKAVLARQRRRPRSSLANGFRMAAWAAAFLIVCTGAISGLNRAAANTLPDEPLYGWKRASERVWLGMQIGPEREIAVSLALADRRVNEMKLLYQRSGRVDREIISQLQIDYTRTLQLIDTLPPEQARPLLARAQAIGAEHEQELMQLAQLATGADQQILLAAVQVSQWVQHTSPEEATESPPAIPSETSETSTAEPAVPGATTEPSTPASKPQPTSPIAPPASNQPPPANNPSTQPVVPPTLLPATPQPTAAPVPPARNPSTAPQPSTPSRPAPTDRPSPPRPTAKPEPTPIPPTAVPPTAAPTDPPPGPPSDPPGNGQPGPPSNPPGNGQPGPPSNPPGNPTVQPGPTIEPPGPPSDPPGNGQPGPPSNPPGNPTVQPGPPSDPPGNGQPGPPSNPPGNPTVQPGPPSDPPGQVKTPKPTDPPKEEKTPKPTNPPKEKK